ncbi:MAG TPA: hypothetical protein DEB25_06380 [Desulfobulbaceae bacterium]|nr:hypothetical protein [Desulfobulbaceae bacterium]
MSELDDETIREAMEADSNAADEMPGDTPPDDFYPDAYDDSGAGADEEAATPPAELPMDLPKDLAALFERHRRELAAVCERIIRQTLKPQPRQPEEGEPPPMPVLPDGLGMSLEQVQNLLAEKHKTIVGLDDPVLMLVTVMNVFLAQESALIERHKTALAKVMADKTGEYVGAVQQVTDSLTKSLSDVTLAAMEKTFAAHSLELAQHKRNIMWLSAIAAISALVNVAVFVIR